MIRTNWSRCFKLALVCLLVASAAVPAAGVSTTDGEMPDEAEVGTQVNASVTLTDLYKEPSLESWTLAGETELADVTWTVTYYDQTGSKVDQEAFDGQAFDGAEIAAADGVSEVRVKVTGTVPEVEAYSYDPAQTVTLVSLTQTRSGGSSNDLAAREIHHYTEESAAARTALDGAAAAIASVDGANTEEAETTLDNAVSAFENGNFELATSLAGEAESGANAAEQSTETRRFIIYAVGGLVALGTLVGGVFWYRSRQSTHDKLA